MGAMALSKVHPRARLVGGGGGGAFTLTEEDRRTSGGRSRVGTTSSPGWPRANEWVRVGELGEQ
jgi:hypothetical protein